ncbi:2OG-Fe(II) oxygenase [Pseudopedobacter saltans DSM 12145]|uniref:2OG-Fe(II) oxygenase n=1 Tax=Pseudopedobacter saltans (strain ATCC 51119 / DSM 12145 / JCM 21818 / CCUG 39354 / LMG 10337 / NBRC 100064 / NCIMB 13643) TaxID=762903 RepID=F0SDI5_PSESL|nr:2-oxoglutarate and iron-dependent oxygenase domain-containing protein [Pseudopedobacter saltans]ADY53968.1 2OG-Fe(II) oxygenase [Pseudopedobacter saltans DSM 12145]
MTSINIPRLDLSKYTEGTTSEKKQFSDDIGKAFNETGFVTITNHGLSKELISSLYEQVKAFFALPEDTKLKYQKVELAGQRGYTSKGREKAKDAKTPDLKEFWQTGQYVQGEDVVKDEYPDNLIVEEVPEFNVVTKEIYKKLETAGKSILNAISVYLGLPEDYFEDKVYNGNSILRAIHYFPIENPDALPADAVRAGAHEDINLITLLIGASADGLEVLTRDGEWFPIKAHGEDIVVNVGDMLQRLTNNKLKSTTHRVVNPPRELMKNSRYSVPFFLHPKAKMDLTCLDSCVDSQHPKAYTDITAGEYLDERLREIGLKM